MKDDIYFYRNEGESLSTQGLDNNDCELRAVERAADKANAMRLGNVIIYTDSQFAVDNFKQRPSVTVVSNNSIDCIPDPT